MSSPDVILTTHAIERFSQRAEDWRKLPLGKIRRAGFCHAQGEIFKVRQGALSYVCRWGDEGTRIVIITIIRPEKAKKRKSF